MPTLRWIFALTLIVLVGCAPVATPIPTATFTPSPSMTPNPTATALPTYAPLPSVAPILQATPIAAVNAIVRAVNGSMRETSFDFYLNNDRAIAFSLRYGRAGGQVEVPAGDYQVQVRTAGSRTEATPVFTFDLTLTTGEAALLLLTDSPNGGSALQIYPEDISPLPGDVARLQAINGLATTINITYGANTQAQAPLFSSLGSAEAATVEGLAVGALNYQIIGNETRYTLDLRARYNHILILLGDPTNPNIISVEDQVVGRSTVQFINASPDYDLLDVYVNDRSVIQVSYSAISADRLNLPAQDVSIVVYNSGDDPENVTPLLQAVQRLVADELTYFVVSGQGDQLQITAHTLNLAPTRPDEARITFMNANTGAPTLFEARQTDYPLSVPYGNSASQSYPAGVLDFEFFDTLPSDDSAHTPLESLAFRSYESGYSYFVVLTGVFDLPVIVSQNVGTEGDSRLVAPLPTPQAVLNTEMLLIHAADVPLQTLLDGLIVNGYQTPNSAIGRFTLTPGNHTIAFTNGDTLAPLGQFERFTEASSQYTSVFFKGTGEGNYILQTFPAMEVIEQPNQPLASLRLLNVSLSPDALNLAYAPVLFNENERASNQIEARLAEDGTRLSFPIPADAEPVGQAYVPNGLAGEANSIFPGDYDLYLFDNNRQIVGAIYAIALDEGIAHEIVAIPDPEGLFPYTLIVIPYR